MSAKKTSRSAVIALIAGVLPLLGFSMIWFLMGVSFLPVLVVHYLAAALVISGTLTSLICAAWAIVSVLKFRERKKGLVIALLGFSLGLLGAFLTYVFPWKGYGY